MTVQSDIEHLATNPDLLFELCRDVIDCIERKQEDPKLREKEIQLREVSRAISKLEKQRVAVPDGLRTEKIRLASELDIKNQIMKTLQYVADELSNISKDLKNRLGVNDDSSTGNQIKRKRSKLPRTDSSVLREETIIALRQLGGHARLSEIFDVMEKQFSGKLQPGDLELRQDGKTLVWKNNTQWERMLMIREGILKSDSPNGIWELTEAYL
ncbi:MAG: winged helix-turn-helix domain-containing protein [Desulfatirhabdiaceae bacterium]